MALPTELIAQHFVPRGVLQRLGPDAVSPQKDIVEVAVLFVDVQDCSTLCETLPPSAMNRLLEMAFGEFLDCVHDAGGDVNEIMGDGFMALFEGRPLQENVRAAARAALAIQQRTVTGHRQAGMPEGPFDVNM